MGGSFGHRIDCFGRAPVDAAAEIHFASSAAKARQMERRTRREERTKSAAAMLDLKDSISGVSESPPPNWYSRGDLVWEAAGMESPTDRVENQELKIQQSCPRRQRIPDRLHLLGDSGIGSPAMINTT